MSMEIVSSETFVRLHRTKHHPETPERSRVLNHAFKGYTEARPAARADLLRCHTEAYVDYLSRIGDETWLDGDTPADATSWEAALLSAGAAIQAVERSGFAFGRPPGHHALPGRAMGFCLFGNAAIAARWAQTELGIGRVAILDWDVHHGNGTQAIVEDDPSIFLASMHQWPFYPGSGGPDDQAENVLNVPMSSGSGDEEYLRAFDHAIAPAIERFDPGLLIVSAGFDAHEQDPLAHQRVTEDGFRELARRSRTLAPRLAAVLEGGYNLTTLPGCVQAAVDGFTASV